MKITLLFASFMLAVTFDAQAASSNPVTFFTVEQFAYIDTGEIGTSLGDMRVGRGRLSSTLYGSPNGQSTWQATVVGILPNNQEQRDYTTEFTWGADSIRVQKVISESRNTPSIRAITGGTGKFRNARGTAHYEPLGDAAGTIKITFKMR